MIEYGERKRERERERKRESERERGGGGAEGGRERGELIGVQPSFS